jgi:hypothetical protein
MRPCGVMTDAAGFFISQSQWFETVVHVMTFQVVLVPLFGIDSIRVRMDRKASTAVWDVHRFTHCNAVLLPPDFKVYNVGRQGFGSSPPPCKQCHRRLWYASALPFVPIHSPFPYTEKM